MRPMSTLVVAIVVVMSLVSGGVVRAQAQEPLRRGAAADDLAGARVANRHAGESGPFGGRA